MVQSYTGILTANLINEINQFGLTWKNVHNILLSGKSRGIEQYSTMIPFLKKIIIKAILK